MLKETGSTVRSPAAQWALLMWPWLLYERENVIQRFVHGRVPQPFEDVFSLLYRIPTDARSALRFRGPEGCLWALFKSTSVRLHAALKQMLGPPDINHTLHFISGTVPFYVISVAARNLKGPNEA